jgi:hypothetical protein
MPHIVESSKKIYKELTDKILTTKIATKGDLEFLVYQLMKAYMSTRERKYSNLHNAVYGVIHSGEEFKRLHLDKREDEALNANGEA